MARSHFGRLGGLRKGGLGRGFFSRPGFGPALSSTDDARNIALNE
jgi:hypothetical protein